MNGPNPLDSVILCTLDGNYIEGTGNVPNDGPLEGLFRHQVGHLKVFVPAGSQNDHSVDKLIGVIDNKDHGSVARQAIFSDDFDIPKENGEHRIDKNFDGKVKEFLEFRNNHIGTAEGGPSSQVPWMNGREYM